MMRTVRAPLHMLWLSMLLAVPLLAAAQEAEPPAAGEQAADVEPVLLRLAYNDGETLTYAMELNGLGSVHVAGAAQAVAVTGTMEMSLQVEEITEDGNYVVLTTMDATGLNVTVEGERVPMTQQLPQMRTTISPRGETLALQLIGAGQQTGGMEAQIGTLLAGENFKHLMALQKVAVFPEEPVAPGAEWGGELPEEEQAEIEAADEPATEITTIYTTNQEFDGVMCARLESDAVIGAGALGEMAAMLQMSGETTTQSTTWFDCAAGRVRASRENAQVNLELTLPAAMTGGQGEFSIFMEMVIDTDTWLLSPGGR